MFHNDRETPFFWKSYAFIGKILFLPSNLIAMKKLLKTIACLLVLVLLFSSCASSRSSRAIRKAERQMEQMEKKSKKQYEQAKTAHYKRQARKTKRMIQKDKRHAEQMRRHQKTNPFFWRLPLIRYCRRIGYYNRKNTVEAEKILFKWWFCKWLKIKNIIVYSNFFLKKNHWKCIFFLRTFK